VTDENFDDAIFVTFTPSRLTRLRSEWQLEGLKGQK